MVPFGSGLSRGIAQVTVTVAGCSYRPSICLSTTSIGSIVPLMVMTFPAKIIDLIN